ncbi:NAD(P)-binding protein [Helicobacter sp. 13S00477-4]|uniref:NAD(P)-binding protein n=1 Tax=Helicobacter sp. 13S00477-4 TaxID=1905759 RepID=UPI000BA5D72F|nr:NAD(P)-binding protein [Helicobacter sp. 13S00477-4]PAF52483.1 hypothetical protein BKH44_01495 [Helicobacter sp. 13S00477-4]
MKIRNLIVGAEISGLVLAERIVNDLKEKVLIIHRRNDIGGNIYDYDKEGILSINMVPIFFTPIIKKYGII